MNTFTAIAILVSVLGFFLIIAVVWLVYKFRSTRRQMDPELAAEPPMRKLIIHRGRVVPASRLATPSVRSGWSSLKHRSWLLSSPPPRLGGMAGYSPYRVPGEVGSSVWHKESLHPVETIVEFRPTSMEQVRENYATPMTAPSQASLPTVRSSTIHFWKTKYPTSSTSDERNTSPHSFLDNASSESLPSFPRPPYLSPLQSRYHVRRAEGPTSPLSQVQRNGG